MFNVCLMWYMYKVIIILSFRIKLFIAVFEIT